MFMVPILPNPEREPSPTPSVDGERYGSEVILPPGPPRELGTPMPPDMPPVRDNPNTNQFMSGTSCRMPDDRIVPYDGPQPFKHLNPCPPGYVPPNERGGGARGPGPVGGDGIEKICKPVPMPDGTFIYPEDCEPERNHGIDLRPCLDIYNRCRSAIENDIEDHLRPAESCCNNITFIIFGDVEKEFERADKCLTKCSAKVQTDTYASLGDCYMRAQRMGLPFPSDAQVALGHETGEFLASCFVDKIEAGELESTCWPEDLLGPNPFPCKEEPPPYCPPPPPPLVCPPEGQEGKPFVVRVDPVTKEQTCEELKCPPGYHPQETFPGSGVWVCIQDDSWEPPPPPPPPPLGDPCTMDRNGIINYVLQTEYGGISAATAAQLDPRVYDTILARADAIKEQCENPQRIDCQFTLQSIPLPDWCRPDIVQQLALWSANVDVNVETFKRLIGLCKGPDGRYGKNLWSKWLYEAKLIPDWVPDALNGIVEGMVEVVWEITEFTAGIATRGSKTGLVFEVLLGLGRLLNRKYGVPSDDWLTKMAYNANVFNPTRIPSTAEANAGYLSGAFDRDTWEAYVKANNDCFEPQRKLTESARTKPGPHELTQLLMRGKIDFPLFSDFMRKSGVLDPEERDWYVELQKQYPGIADIIRFLLRDVADPNVVNRFSLDAEFEQKWQGDLTRYATAQGIDTNLARLFWRAHWEFPSNTQLFEMLHRLRPGQVPKAIEVTENDVATVLGINDLNPYWRQRMMAISYSPLTRVDVQRAFFIGALQESDVYDSYRDLGYDDGNAKKLVEFTKELKRIRERNRLGKASPKELLKKFAAGEMTQAEFVLDLAAAGFDNDGIEAAVDSGLRRRELSLRDAKVKLLRRRYKRFEFDKNELIQNLGLLGLDASTASYLANRWELDLTAGNKLIAAEKLCKAKERGLISSTDYTNGLLKLGYSREDAMTIGGLCDADIDKRAVAAIEKGLKEAERKRDKEKREMEKQQKEAERREKDKERKRKEREKEMKAAAKG